MLEQPLQKVNPTISQFYLSFLIGIAYDFGNGGEFVDEYLSSWLLLFVSMAVATFLLEFGGEKVVLFVELVKQSVHGCAIFFEGRRDLN